MQSEIAAAFVLGLSLICSTGLAGFMAMSGAWYLTHRPVERFRPLGPVRERLAEVLPPPVQPTIEEIVLHPAVQDYIQSETEGWYREQLKEKAKSLYAEHPQWDWVLTQLRSMNESPESALPEI